MTQTQQATHTPGPWRVSLAAPTKTRGIDIIDGHGRFVWHVRFHYQTWVAESEREQDRANARLIAAAPKLLAALKALTEWNGAPGSHPSALWHAARAAITKAEGR